MKIFGYEITFQKPVTIELVDPVNKKQMNRLVKKLLKKNKRVGAVKVIKKFTGLGLVDAKNYLNEHYR